MDTPQQPNFDESLAQVMQDLPPVIRTYLSQGKYTPVAKDLATKYKLSPDQGGVLEREIILLLMGVETPDEFTKALAEELRLDQASVDGIAQDINTQIFVPLRNENDRGTGNPVVPQQSVPVPQPPKLAIHSNIQSKGPLTGAPLPPKFMLPSREVAALKAQNSEPEAAMMPVVQPSPEALLPIAPVAPTSVGLQAAVVATVAPAARAQAPVVLPPQNLPGAMPPIDTAEIEKTHPIQPVAPIVPVAMPIQEATQPGLPVLGKPLPGDPYREPIDEA